MNKFCKLLLVDDESMATEIFKGIFEDDFIVATACSGKEALSLVHSFMPDIIVLDAVMPGIDGWEVCRRIKSESSTQSIVIIMVSARAISMQDRKAAYEAGADDYIVKPFINEDLFAKVNVWARVKKTESEVLSKVKELESIRNELRKSKDVLEKKVNERTSELLRINEELRAEIESIKKKASDNDCDKA